MDVFLNLAKSIKNSRLAKGITQEEFAEMLNVSSTHIKHLESGHRKPSVDILFSICKITDISIDSIVLGEKLFSQEIDQQLFSSIQLCSEEEKSLILKLIEAVIANRK